jgi:hypothetical protein
MYIDARKRDYAGSAMAADEIARDKSFTRQAYRDWFDAALDGVIDRLWEIDDIGVVEQTDAFIKLLKEAEFTYSLGAYTSTIAMVGVCAEDLCRFFAEQSGNAMDNASQFNRVNGLAAQGLLSSGSVAKFDQIRIIRNQCLHYDHSFKAKSQEDLKQDALNALNSMKSLYADIIGVTSYETLDASKLIEVVSRLADEAAGGDSPDVRNVDQSVMRIRNVLSEVTGVDLSVDLGGKKNVRWSIYRVVEVDFDMTPPEVTLVERDGPFVPVIVDLDAKEADHLTALGVAAGDDVLAALVSISNRLGMTGEWRFLTRPVKLPPG